MRMKHVPAYTQRLSLSDKRDVGYRAESGVYLRRGIEVVAVHIACRVELEDDELPFPVAGVDGHAERAAVGMAVGVAAFRIDIIGEGRIVRHQQGGNFGPGILVLINNGAGARSEVQTIDLVAHSIENDVAVG